MKRSSSELLLAHRLIDVLSRDEREWFRRVPGWPPELLRELAARTATSRLGLSDRQLIDLWTSHVELCREHGAWWSSETVDDEGFRRFVTRYDTHVWWHLAKAREDVQESILNDYYTRLWQYRQHTGQGLVSIPWPGTPPPRPPYLDFLCRRFLQPATRDAYRGLRRHDDGRRLREIAGLGDRERDERRSSRLAAAPAIRREADALVDPAVLVERADERAHQRKLFTVLLPHLSDDQLRLLDLERRGLSDQQIADALDRRVAAVHSLRWRTRNRIAALERGGMLS